MKFAVRSVLLAAGLTAGLVACTGNPPESGSPPSSATVAPAAVEDSSLNYSFGQTISLALNKPING